MCGKMRHITIGLLLLLMLCLTIACGKKGPEPGEKRPVPAAVSFTPTPTFTPSPSPTPTSTLTPTPDPVLLRKPSDVYESEFADNIFRITPETVNCKCLISNYAMRDGWVFLYCERRFPDEEDETDAAWLTVFRILEPEKIYRTPALDYGFRLAPGPNGTVYMYDENVFAVTRYNAAAGKTETVSLPEGSTYLGVSDDDTFFTMREGKAVGYSFALGETESYEIPHASDDGAYTVMFGEKDGVLYLTQYCDQGYLYYAVDRSENTVTRLESRYGNLSDCLGAFEYTSRTHFYYAPLDNPDDIRGRSKNRNEWTSRFVGDYFETYQYTSDGSYMGDIFRVYHRYAILFIDRFRWQKIILTYIFNNIL